MHEMDMDMAFVLVVLKRILATAPSLKLILMSATADSRKTSAYFSAPVPERGLPGAGGAWGGTRSGGSDRQQPRSGGGWGGGGGWQGQQQPQQQFQQATQQQQQQQQQQHPWHAALL